MYKKIKPLFLICETPLHAGSGSDLGIVDLPIQRERHTSFPKIEASTLKGALREALESNILNKLEKNNTGDYTNKESIKPEIKKLNQVFGFDGGALKGFSDDEMKGLFDETKREFSGCIGFTDARLLLFPVKSLYGVFAWITCPRVLKRFISDMKLDMKLPFVFNETKGITPDRVPYSLCSLFDKPDDKENRIIMLEEFIFNNIENEAEGSNLNIIANWFSENVFKGYDSYWRDKVKTDIVVLDDTDFRDFVNLSTEVITRTKINNETGTVQSGALFSEEYLPAESVLYSMAMFADEFLKQDENSNQKAIDTEGVVKFFESGLSTNGNIIQVGGNATLGKGIIRTAFVNQ